MVFGKIHEQFKRPCTCHFMYDSCELMTKHCGIMINDLDQVFPFAKIFRAIFHITK